MLYAKFRSNRCRYSRKKEAKVFKSLRTTKDDVQIQIAKGLSDLDDEESPDLRPEPLMEGLYFKQFFKGLHGHHKQKFSFPPTFIWKQKNTFKKLAISAY